MIAAIVGPSCPKILAALRRFTTFLFVSASASPGISVAAGRTRQGEKSLLKFYAYAYDLLRRDGHAEGFGKALPWFRKLRAITTQRPALPQKSRGLAFSLEGRSAMDN